MVFTGGTTLGRCGVFPLVPPLLAVLACLLHLSPIAASQVPLAEDEWLQPRSSDASAADAG